MLGERAVEHGGSTNTDVRSTVLIGQGPTGHRNEWWGSDSIKDRLTKMSFALSDISSYRCQILNGHLGRRMLVGYARTSTTDQPAGLAAQERDLRAAERSKFSSNRYRASRIGPD